MTSLFFTLLRDLIFIACFAYLFAFIIGLGEQGIWWGILAGDIAGSLVGYLWGLIFICRFGNGDKDMQVQAHCRTGQRVITREQTGLSEIAKIRVLSSLPSRSSCDTSHQ